MHLRLVFVRHGLSSFNEKGLIQGRSDDSHLTQKGFKEAEAAGQALSEINFDKIYSSPLKRAAETAITIEKIFKKEYQINFDDDLLEVDLNSWSGLTIDEIKNKHPNSHKIWKNDPENLSLKDSNNKIYFPIKELYSQAKNFIDRILSENHIKENSNILIIGHNAILRCLILSLAGKPKNGFRKIHE